MLENFTSLRYNRLGALIHSAFTEQRNSTSLGVYSVHRPWGLGGHGSLMYRSSTSLYRSSHGHVPKWYVPKCIGADSMGAMGAIAPTAKTLWGDAPKSPPQEFGYLKFFWNSKMSHILHRHLIVVVCSQNVQQCLICILCKWQRCADFSLKMHQKRLAARLRPDPLGELTVLARSLVAGFKE